MASLIKGLGTLLWNYGGKQTGGAVVGASKLAASGAGAVLEPWADKGSDLLGKVARKAIFPYPQEMGNLAKGIDAFIPIKQKKYQAIETLQQTIKENGFEANADHLRKRFPALSVMEADKIAAVVGKDLQQPFHVEEEGGTLVFSDDQMKIFQEVSGICKKYGTQTDEAVHSVFVSQLNGELNDDASPIVKNARAALENLLFPPKKVLNPVQFKERTSKAILDLCALSPTPADAPLLTQENLDKIRDVIILLAEWLDDPTLTKVPKASVPELQGAHQIVVALYDAQQGVLPRTFDNFTHRMQAVGVQFKDMVTGFLPTDPDAPAEGEATVGGLFKKAKGWFDSLFVNVENAVTHQAVRAFSVVLEEMLAFVKDHLSSTNAIQEKNVKDAVAECIHQLQDARNHGSFAMLKLALANCFHVFAQPEREVYLQNIRMPFNPVNFTSVVPDLLNLAKAHEVKEEPKKITPMMVEQMANRFKERSVFFIASKAIEGIFGIAVEESDYAAIINPSQDIPPSAFSTIFRTQFFLCIDRSKASSIGKWGAKCVYYVVQGFASLFVHTVIDSIRSEFDEWRKRDIREKGKNVLQLGRHIFSVISGAYASVGRTEPEYEKDIFSLLTDAVKSPARNAGLPPKKFYGALIMTALKFVRFNWIKQIGNYFDELPASSSGRPFLQSILDGVNWFCKRTLQALVYIPQKFFNFLLQKTTGFFISRSVELDTVIDEHLGKLQDPLTPTSFAIHVVIEKKLREITELVQARLNKPDLEVENIPSTDIQIEVVTLIKSVLHVIEQSRKHTVHDLRQYEKADRTFFEQFQREVLEQVLPQARLPLSTTLWATLQEALSEESLLEMMYNTFAIADKTFERQENVTEQQFHAVDKGIADLGQTLIQMILKKILDDKLDINNIRQQAEISKFTATFKQKIEEFLLTISQLQRRIADPTTPERIRRETVFEMNQAIHKFIYQEIEALGNAGINAYLHQGTKRQLNELAKELNNKITYLSQNIEAMHDLQEKLDTLEKAKTAFTGARDALRTLEHMLRYPQEGFNNPEHFAVLLEQHMAILNKQTLYPCEELIKQHNRFKEYQTQLKATQQTILHLQTVEGHWNGYIALKEQNLPENEARLSAAYRHLVRLIHLLPDQAQRELLASLFDVQRCVNPDLIPDLKARFTNAFEKTRIQKETEVQEIRMELGSVKEMMQPHLNNLEKAQLAIREQQALLLATNQGLLFDFAALETWEKSLTDVTIININFIDFMDWMQNTIHSLAVSETNKIMNEVRDVMLLPFVYTCMINQVGVKFLERYGKEYIKKD
jgi:hypothetical protein